ncbi:hypothetical protein ACPR111641_08070 [Acinetobacter pragensis]
MLFLSAFGAATLLPLQSEAVLLGLLVNGQQSAWALILVASIGNILGSCVNWWLGLKIEHYKNKKWFPVSEAKMMQAQAILSKIRLLVFAAELDAYYRRSNYAHCRAAERKFLALFNFSQCSEDRALCVYFFHFYQCILMRKES